ncbi:MAG: hypothetical protein NC395_10555 [Prevotella sp.]|nr:hypothetical protein [Prevotella sp.]
MSNYDFFIIDVFTLAGTVINTALLGGLIFLFVRTVKAVLKNKNKK